MKKNLAWMVVPGVAFATLLSLVACSGSKKEQKPQTVTEASINKESDEVRKLREQANAAEASGNKDEAKKLRAQADQKAKGAADHYARLGELLLMPEGAQYADEMFAKALELDPANNKANLYKASTEVMMVFKGFIPRIERLSTDREFVRGIEQMRDTIAKWKLPEVSEFASQLPSGAQPMTNVYDVQRFARETLLPTVMGAIARLDRVNAAEPIKLNVTPSRFSPVKERNGSYNYYQSYCFNDTYNGWTCNTTEWHYDSGTPYTDRNEFMLDKHDLNLIKMNYVSIANALRVGTAFKIKDMEYAIRRLQAIDEIRRQDGKALSARDVVSTLKEYPELLTIEQDQQLGQVAASASQVLKAGVDYYHLRSELCDHTQRDAYNSLTGPICVSADVADALKIGIDMLAGPTEVEIGRDRYDNRVYLVMDVTALLKSPVRDLKDLLPREFDVAGEPVRYPDDTFGGVFPNGDLLEKLQQIGQYHGKVNKTVGKSRTVLKKLKGI